MPERLSYIIFYVLQMYHQGALTLDLMMCEDSGTVLSTVWMSHMEKHRKLICCSLPPPKKIQFQNTYDSA